MKKLFLGLVLAAAAATASADVYFNYSNNLWYGNICRSGPYFSVVAYAPIGYGCWNYGWGREGVITGQ